MMKLEKQNLASVREKCILKALAGFLESSTDLLDERIQTIFFDMTESLNDRLLMRQILKYFYMNINLISKTPVAFQKFAAETVCTLYKERELRVEELIPLDWIVKYITIYSILETSDEPREAPNLASEALQLRIGETSGTTYHYIVGNASLSRHHQEHREEPGPEQREHLERGGHPAAVHLLPEPVGLDSERVSQHPAHRARRPATGQQNPVQVP
jgi:hypothetical protein